MSSFGELLRRLRGSRSQRAVAKDLGMPVTTLSTLENQTTLPRGSVLKRLSEYYGVQMNYFYAAPASAMKSTDSAKAWLRSLREKLDVKETIAAYSSWDVPEEIKVSIAKKLKLRKHAEGSDHD